MSDRQQEKIEAAAFRRLLKHLAHRTDVQNIDLMIHGGFCRNCLADWYKEAAEQEGLDIDKETAREYIYAMPYKDYKARYQTPASEEQLAAMQESIARNKST